MCLIKQNISWIYFGYVWTGSLFCTRFMLYNLVINLLTYVTAQQLNVSHIHTIDCTAVERLVYIRVHKQQQTHSKSAAVYLCPFFVSLFLYLHRSYLSAKMKFAYVHAWINNVSRSSWQELHHCPSRSYAILFCLWHKKGGSIYFHCNFPLYFFNWRCYIWYVPF